LVTGGLGFIGSHLVDRLVDGANDVTVLDDLSSGSKTNLMRPDSPHLKIIRGSILNRDQVAQSMKGADAVVHLAAIVSVQRSISEPNLTHDVNVTGTLNLLSEAARQEIDKFVFASSAAVYGKSKSLPLREDSPVNPLSPYGASKAASEAYCKAFFESMKLATVILRFMNVYGPRRSSGAYAGVMMKFAEAISNDKPLIIYGDGEQSRDFTYVSDIVDAIVLSLESEKTKGVLMNVGTGKPHTINQLAEVFEDLRDGRPAGRQFMSERTGDIRSSYADISVAKNCIGYEPRIELKSGVREFMDWYRNQTN
jgi:UDP-glucose 4-epimerase